MIDRIKELLDRSNEFSPGLNKELRIDNHTQKCVGTFYIKDEPLREPLRALLDTFDDVLSHYEIYLRSGKTLDDALSIYRFGELEQLARADLKRAVTEFSMLQEDDEAYCLLIWLDVPQSVWYYHLSLEKAFEEALSKKRSGKRPHLFQTKAQVQRFRYYGYGTESVQAGAELQQHLVSASEELSAMLDIYGGRLSGDAYYHLFELMADLSARVLRDAYSDITAKLACSKDFVVLVTFYDQDDATHYRAATRCMDQGKLKATMGDLYAPYL